MARKKGEREPMDANVTVRMTQSLHDRLAALADADRRRIGEYVRLILEDVVPIREQHGQRHVHGDEDRHDAH